MLKSHVTFHSAHGKRQLLVVDDEPINRELLSMMLEDDFEVLTAKDGTSALEAVQAHHQTLSLVLLDLQMPDMHGLEVLRQLRMDPLTGAIPVIVMTAEQSSEVESLTMGAMDFIPKPYPQREVIIARVQRTIELCEDRDIIRSTERDALTGLYTRDYFYRYAQQYDQYHEDVPMDAMVVDINHFHTINERFGRAYGDEVLRQIGEHLRGTVQEVGGIVCRREGDTFLLYCPHRDDYQKMLESASMTVTEEGHASQRVRLRMGVYSNVDKSIDMERRFDRAKQAADKVRSSYANAVSVYDMELQEKELYAEQLLEGFHDAISERQFVVYYQPKFDIRPEIPILSSAEALVRWQHPTLGMISPGVFIPLFEKNGLIQNLDEYVWREAAAKIRELRDRYGISIPVSVNVSRVDIADPELIHTFSSILERHGLEPSDLLLEITESAYTENSEQIVERVKELRNLGFQIEMDDFGTGYSSLNMISNLPIDALKLDMQFVRNAFNERKDTRMIKVIIDIADSLQVPVIAEGVETEEQLKTLKEMGCDIVQGYYFSRPVPAEEYETFVSDRAQNPVDEAVDEQPQKDEQAPAPDDVSMVMGALTRGYESIFDVNLQTGRFVEFSAEAAGEEMQIHHYGEDFFEEVQQRIAEQVWDEDRERVSLSLKKETLEDQLVGQPFYSMTYRKMVNGMPTYYNLRVVSADVQEQHRLVIGISNVEEQMQQARDLANRDALTGVKSRIAYRTAQSEANRRIHDGEETPFAVVVCDLNGLKEVNDTQGHAAGDAYIQQACRMICEIFDHSPVYRIGGDEFVAILRKGDYDHREALVEKMREVNRKNRDEGKVVVACGIADYIPGTDRTLTDVFERADAQMYEEKKQLKEQ